MSSKRKGRKRYESSSDSDSIDSDEEARRRDIKERDEFSNRLKKRDETKTRNITQVSDKRAYEEGVKRLKVEKEGREKIVPMLRIQSRRKYLEKRKDDKITELEEDIADDEYLFEKEM